MESEWLPMLKASLHIDYDDADCQLLALLKTAHDFAMEYTIDEGQLITADDRLPMPLIQGIVMLAAHWYEQPMATTSLAMHDNSFGFWTLIGPYLKV